MYIYFLTSLTSASESKYSAIPDNRDELILSKTSFPSALLPHFSPHENGSPP